MAAALPLAPTEALPLLQRKPASDVKREGWRGIMKAVDAAGRLLVTNHDEPQAVILSLSEYRALSELADSARRQQQDRLEQLAREFDDDLAVLKQAEAADRLRAAFAAPQKLRGKVVAGQGH
ncbi:MAG: type II toxin-antitoxin system prevent-host-death family antitoxin [Burkholderiales bacterium]|nr:type II toxin-antitoxin system prevent-host-death family antitoxin [Burkholderiales bacterium]